MVSPRAAIARDAERLHTVAGQDKPDIQIHHVWIGSIYAFEHRAHGKWKCLASDFHDK